MVFIQCIAHFLTILSLVQVRISAAILFLSVFHISMSLNNTVVFFVVWLLLQQLLFALLLAQSINIG